MCYKVHLYIQIYNRWKTVKEKERYNEAVHIAQTYLGYGKDTERTITIDEMLLPAIFQKLDSKEVKSDLFDTLIYSDILPRLHEECLHLFAKQK